MKLNVMILVQLMWLLFVCFLHNFIANPRLPDYYDDDDYNVTMTDNDDDDWWRQRHLDDWDHDCYSHYSCSSNQYCHEWGSCSSCTVCTDSWAFDGRCPSKCDSSSSCGGNDQLTAFYVFAFLQVSKPRPTTQQLTNPNYCNYGI
jgi:hypothetical protein